MSETEYKEIRGPKKEVAERDGVVLMGGTANTQIVLFFSSNSRRLAVGIAE